MWQIAELLIARGADLEARTSENNIWGWMKFKSVTPLLVAVEAGGKETVKVLCDAGANIRVENKDLEIPIQIASRRGDKPVLEVLSKVIEPF